MKSFRTKELTLIAALTAIEIVLSRFLSINAWNIKIGFNFVPIAAAAVLLGPVEAGLVAAIGDFLGAILFPIGAYFPGFTLTAFLSGLCFGFFLSEKRSSLRILLAVAINQLLLSLLLNSLWISVLYGSPYLPLLGTRLIQCAVLFPVQFAVIVLFTRSSLCDTFVSSLTASRKKDLRREMRSKSRAMEPGKRAESDRKIFDNIIDMAEYKKAGTVFSYVSVEDEVDTRALLTRVLLDGKRLCVPRLSDKLMEAKEITDLSLLAPSAYNIPEPPTEALSLSPTEIDFTLIPCASCNQKGDRLGRGGGYYDRFLREYKGAAALVCRESLMRKHIPLEAHDVNVPLVVTDRAIYRKK